MIFGLSKKQRRSVINSIGLAILLSANPLSWLFPRDNIILVYASISLIIVLFNNSITTFVNNKVLLILGVLLLFLVSYQFADIDKDTFFLYFYSFIAFGITGVLYASTDFDFETLFKALFVIAFLTMPGIYRVSTTDYIGMGDVSGFWMGISQGAVRLIMATIMVFPLFKNSFFKWLTIPVLFVYLFFMISFGTRGATLSLIVFVFLLYLEKKRRLNLYGIILILIIGGLINIFIIDIIKLVVDTLTYFEIEFKALEKILRMHDLGLDASNGRNEIWKQAFIGFIESPIYGNGVATYINKYNGYPHNFFLEILYEGGLLYGAPIAFVFIIFSKLILSSKIKYEQKTVLIFLFCAGIMEVVFSSVYWRNMFFWFFVAYVININSTYRNKCHIRAKSYEYDKV